MSLDIYLKKIFKHGADAYVGFPLVPEGGATSKVWKDLLLL